MIPFLIWSVYLSFGDSIKSGEGHEGLLHNGGVYQSLREELINDHAVKAVITLQAGLFRPYVTTPMHILLFQKAFENARVIKPPPLTWFLHIGTDGYPLDASRDLTDPPPASFGDLPLAQASIPHDGDEQERFQPVLGRGRANSPLETGLSYKSLMNTPGMILKVNANTTLFSLRFFLPSDRETYLVAQASLQDRASIYSVIPCVEDRADLEKVEILSSTATFNQWIRRVFRVDKTVESKDLPAGRYIFGDGRADQMIAITSDWRLLGFTKTREEIREAEYLLSEDRYWDRHAESLQEIKSTAQMLQEIRENQRRINDDAENLLGQLEFKQVLTESLPPELFELEQFPLMAFLGPEQERIWKKICRGVPPVDQNSPEGKYAWPFTLEGFLKEAENEEVKNRDEEGMHRDEEPVTVEQTLQLLERLGLIVQVAPPNTSAIFYRRVTQLDRGLWPYQPESE